jgi:GNAT superfamily N-acetyltransferase
MVRIRVPAPDEWELARELRLRALRDSPLAYLETLAQAEARDERGWRERVAPSPTRHQVVAIADDGEWVGSMAVLTAAEPPTLVAVFVDPRHRGDGTAVLLLEAIAGWLRERGHRRLRLQVGAHNDRARAFYERMGFVATGDVEHYAGHPVAEHEMIRDLTRPL